MDEFENGITSKQIRVDCTGGGRILHEPEKKSILVYGYSQVIERCLFGLFRYELCVANLKLTNTKGFGRADHQMTVDLLKQHYTDYESITFSNEGY